MHSLPSHGYDTAGRPKSVSTTIPGLSKKTTSYRLDKAGNRTQLKWPDGYYVNYGYDALNRMGTATDSTGVALATYAYDDFSRRSGVTYANTASMSYTYTTAGDLTRLVNQLTDTNSVTYTLGYTGAHELNGETASKAKYIWDPSQSGGTDAYGAPNDLNQYPSVTFSGGSQQAFSYDLNGSILSDSNFTYTYDPENRLLSSKPSGTAKTTYSNDPKGRRAVKVNGSTTTNFLDDGDDEIAEYDGSGTLLRRFVPGAAIDERIAYVTASGTYEYFHTDHHGSVVVMSDSTGAEAEGAFTYDSYGNSSCSGSGGVPFRYTGQYLDPETCLYYYRARYYSPALGRFLQVDPVGYTVDMDLYTYVGNDPTNETDPTGLSSACTGDSGSGEAPTGSRIAGGDSSVACGSTAELSKPATQSKKKPVVEVAQTDPIAAEPESETNGQTQSESEAASKVDNEAGAAQTEKNAAEAAGQETKESAAKAEEKANPERSIQFGDFKSLSKWQSQMNSRGWTSDQILQAIGNGTSYPAPNNIHPENGATRYEDPVTRQSVVIDNKTGEVIHIGGPGFKY